MEDPIDTNAPGQDAAALKAPIGKSLVARARRKQRAILKSAKEKTAEIRRRIEEARPYPVDD
jgi:hypothetical protein